MKEEQQKEPTKKEKAQEAGKDVAEVGAKAAATYFGGAAGGKIADAALDTKIGQAAAGKIGNTLARNPLLKGTLARNQKNIRRTKPILNTLAGSTSSSTSSSTSNLNALSQVNSSESSIQDISEEINNSASTSTKSEKLSGEVSSSAFFKKLPLKVKLIIIGGIASLIFIIIFIVVMLMPLMELEIINIEGMGGTGVNGGISYTPINQSKNYWWPVGSRDTTTSNGITYASGEPESTYITSLFGTRSDPFGGETVTHNGLDIGGNGENGVINVIAAYSGTVIYPTTGSPTNCPSSNSEDNCGGGYGNYVMIEHNDGKITLYAHLDTNTILVKAGDTVKQGQVIAKMGSSGRSTGPHLHFEVRIDGNRVDPLNYINPDNPRPVSGSTNHIIGDSNQQTVCLSLQANNFSENGTIALMTNINHESGFDPNALGDNGTSFGICQWHEGRYANLMSSYPDSYKTIESQISFLVYELDNGYSSLYNGLLTGNESASTLTYRFCKEFERPADSEITCQKRGNNAKNFISYVQNGCK